MNNRPRIAVLGLWHLGCVTAASLAQERFHVSGVDPDPGVVSDLQKGRPPIFEPGLGELVAEMVEVNRLTFTNDYQAGLGDADVVWVTFDTPVDEEDQADVGYVRSRLDAAFPYIKAGTLLIVSSQVPIGFTHQLQHDWQVRDPGKRLIYAYSPENLRLGNALKAFRASDRIVVGLDGEEGRQRMEALLAPFCPRLEWMTIASAEMTKHAVNSFLAISVASANEIARLCERTGADAKEVEQAMKSEARIGPRAYVSPGAPFGGGTLARDLRFLTQIAAEHQLESPLMEGALMSNEVHKRWVRETTSRLLEETPRPARVAVLGLTYKAGTDTLRRSESLELARSLAKQGVEVAVHDPVVMQLPQELATDLRLTSDISEALNGADLLVLGTGWPLYQEEINPELLRQTMRRPAVIDQNRFLAAQLEKAPEVEYVAVGKPQKPAIE